MESAQSRRDSNFDQKRALERWQKEAAEVRATDEPGRESHFADEIRLDDIAATAGVSRYHLVRAFGAVTGYSVLRYMRARRLSEAAKALANGGGARILDVAIEAGYGSHEAFTRAFRQQFGVAPETLRTEGAFERIQLVEPIRMNETQLADLAPPRFEDGRPLLIAGVRERYTQETSAAIPSQWQRFHAYLGNIPRQRGKIAYGVCYNTDEDGNMDYMSGVEVASFDDIQPELERVRLPAQRYAVFRHSDHISTIRRSWMTVFGKWFPGSGYEVEDAPVFERYGEDFDPETGLGGFELWVPIRDKGRGRGR